MFIICEHSRASKEEIYLFICIYVSLRFTPRKNSSNSGWPHSDQQTTISTRKPSWTPPMRLYASIFSEDASCSSICPPVAFNVHHIRMRCVMKYAMPTRLNILPGSANDVRWNLNGRVEEKMKWAVKSQTRLIRPDELHIKC